MANVKEKLIKIIEQMPDNSEIEDIMARLYFVHKVNKGLQDLDEGKGISHQAVKEDMKQWLE